MLAAKTRSGLVESVHDGAVAVMSTGGDLIAWSGDIDRPFFLRSSAKPFQALVSQQAGASLQSVELALACASHSGEPVHVAIVEAMLHSVDLDATYLKCPPDWPIADWAFHRLAQRGHNEPERIWHNCSGKHAAMLRACRAQDWRLDSYVDPQHPLQLRIANLVSELGEFSVRPVGVDGCGVPSLRTTARSMALLYARLASAPELERIFGVMHRYPSLISGTGRGDGSITTAINAAAKSGAAGCLGVAVKDRLGMAVKAWDGLGEAAVVAAISTLDSLGALPGPAVDALERQGHPEVLGGGRPVGVMEPRLELRWS